MFLNEGSETLEQIVQRNCGCLMPRSVQGHVGWNHEQPGLVESVPAQDRALGTTWSLRFLSTQTLL